MEDFKVTVVLGLLLILVSLAVSWIRYDMCLNAGFTEEQCSFMICASE